MPYWIENKYGYLSCSLYYDIFDGSNIKVPFGCELHTETDSNDYSFWNLDETCEYDVYTININSFAPENTVIFTDYCKSFKLVYGENPNKHKICLHKE